LIFQYDAQIGRFNTQDRFAEKYHFLTPYQYGANNPIKFIDVNGDSLILNGNSEAIAEFEKSVNEGLGGFYSTKVSESGTYSLVATGKKGKMTKQQAAFHKAVNGVMTSRKDVSVNVVVNDSKIDIGSFPTSTIDIGDINKFNSINDKGASGSTREGLLAHELVEQNALQNSNVNRSDPQALLDAFNNGMHADAISAENDVNGNDRISKMESTRMYETNYTKYLYNGEGMTVETITTGAKDMQISKHTIKLSINTPQ